MRDPSITGRCQCNRRARRNRRSRAAALRAARFLTNAHRLSYGRPLQ
ncbi:hypothetical protein BSIN_4198 [Burkholderia singularis]|uniref:Uncharacterized protein n=1 Tax=Burkholderia singularis TaxID=1503053 RepID=A0A238H7U9_9BURK|nr:hypothetical protein BSIN_4198 [Burkholderia singularis]